ncbi:vitamin K epoxide reductase family protein [Altibacter sp. HG106]|uniref:vitamin K epoxide reductase family protein n=1 Tax=Altibacter sp. HG106 TaxID=3023937 RepID=UPI0023505F8A|nr:vitamin K epoxide reductase family protein [Altibacter sp. HG106]MDC7994282.1 vitamin K epoxide reductase family protein [Altibacter sp. HG106]
MKTAMHSLLKKLLLTNHINIHQDELKFQLASHPSYPSLHAIVGVLDHFSIPNAALKMPTTKENLEQLPSSFLGVLSSETGDTLSLVEKRGEQLKITDENSAYWLTEEVFLTRWNGILVAIEKDESVKESTKNPLSRRIHWGVIAVLLGLTGFFFYSVPSVYPASFYAFSFLGVLLAGLIVRHELGFHSQATQKLCNFSEKASCDAVLGSKGATLPFGIKLSDVSFVYFFGMIASGWIAMVLGDAFWGVWGILSMLAVPIVIYSVYYQAVVVKKWCPLCLALGGILSLQAALSVFFVASERILTPSPSAVLLVLGIVFFSAMLWAMLKPLLIKQEEFAKLNVAHTKFKRNFSFFQAALQEEAPLAENPIIPNELQFGNPDAAVQLTLVTSPLCIFCKQAHQDLAGILEQHPEQVSLRIRFNADAEAKESMLTKISSQLLHIYHTQSPAAAWKELHRLYSENADVPAWVEAQSIHFNPAYDTVIEAQREWCSRHQINFTPALYLNDQAFPKQYDRTDLAWFIEELTQAYLEEAEAQQNTLKAS